MSHESAYGLWSLVIINSAVFLIFAFSFFKPKTKQDWRSFSAFSAFVVALFVEMYGFPLTIYLLSGWLGTRLDHDSGHLWFRLLGLHGDPHWNPIHLLSNGVILGGFLLLAAAWRVLYAAQRAGQLATTGAYSYIRHPQYVGFVLIMLGFLLQWPTLPTLVMFPILVAMYARLGRREEREMRTGFGATWDAYATQTPRYLPRLRRHAILPIEGAGHDHHAARADR